MSRERIFEKPSQEGVRIPEERKSRWGVVTIIFLSALSLFLLYVYASQLDLPPEEFPLQSPFMLPEGTNIREAADLLKEQGFVRSSTYIKFILSTKHSDTYIHAGSYLFDRPLTTKEISSAITKGLYISPTYKATFPEGFRTELIKEYLPKGFNTFDQKELSEHEGYLFPDTYYFSETTDIHGLATLMRENFDKKIAPLADKIEDSDFTLDEIVILASLVEREANDETSMRMVAGILQNRLRENMPLQVDATFEYLLGKASRDLTVEDLEIDSPYNTYEYRGLPPTPIANPGLTAILAVLDPIPTEYLYYLTGNDGHFYYAETFEKHKLNKERYLR